jgi:hypothetical protein
MTGFPITSSGATIFSLASTGGAFNTSILSTITSAQGSLNSCGSQLTNIASSSLNNLNFSGFSGMASSLTTIAASGGALDVLSTQASSQFANLANNAGLYQGQLSLQQGLQGVGAGLQSLNNFNFNGNLCAALDTAFGSITGVASGLIGTITTAVETITSTITALIAQGEALVQSAINAAVQAVTGLISTIEGAAASILSQVSGEIAFLTNALGDLLNYSVVGALNTLFGSQCGKQLLNAVGSSALLSALNG